MDCFSNKNLNNLKLKFKNISSNVLGNCISDVGSRIKISSNEWEKGFGEWNWKKQSDSITCKEGQFK